MNQVTLHCNCLPWDYTAIHAASVLQLGHFNSPLKAHHWKEKLNWYFTVSPEVTLITSVHGPLANSRCMASPTSRSSVEYRWTWEISIKNFPFLIFDMLKEFIQFFPLPKTWFSSILFSWNANKNLIWLLMLRYDRVLMMRTLPLKHWNSTAPVDKGLIEECADTWHGFKNMLPFHGGIKI